MGQITIKHVMSDLSTRYAWDNGDTIQVMADKIFREYKANLRADKGGCYVLAFEWAEKKGLIRKKIPSKLEDSAKSGDSITDPPLISIRQTPEQYLKEYEQELQACER